VESERERERVIYLKKPCVVGDGDFEKSQNIAENKHLELQEYSGKNS
jgi:hypothetical protein